MERQNNPEKQLPKMYDDCSSCETKYELTPENTSGFVYKKQPEVSFLYCVCPNCDYRTRIYTNEQTLELAAKKGIVLLQDDWADQEIYRQWLDLKGIELPKEHELTDRHEKIIKGFSEALNAMPNDFFWDNIEAPTNQPYPIRWAE